MSLRVRSWLRKEWNYIEKKHDLRSPEGLEIQHGMTRSFGSEEDRWKIRLEQYYNRARVLGLETPAGRQALAKFVATAVGMLDDVITVYGHIPAPGVSSGAGADRLED